MVDFKESLFSCEKTPGLFCFLLSFACIGGPCCVQAKIASEYSKKPAVLHCVFPCLCLCIGAAYNRQSLRERLGLDQSFLSDCLSHTLCNPCAVNQEFLEYNSQNSHNSLSFFKVKLNKPNKGSFTPVAPVDLTVN